MKIAVSSTGNSLESEVDARFGRCPWFIVVDTNDMSYKAFANINAGLSSGAGIKAAGFLADEGVQSVLTGNCGPKASQVFVAAGIDVHTGYGGTVQVAVEKFKQKAGEGQPATAAAEKNRPVSPETANLPFGPGGGGRGMGMGGGRGMGGGGCGRGMGRSMASYTRPEMPEEETLEDLKQQAADLKAQMAALDQKIKQLGKKK